MTDKVAKCLNIRQERFGFLLAIKNQVSPLNNVPLLFNDFENITTPLKFEQNSSFRISI